MRSCFVGSVLFVALAIWPTRAVGEDNSVPELLTKLPDNVNAVAVIKLENLLNCPRARQEHWGDTYEVGYLSGSLVIPPTVRTAVLGARFDPATQSRSQEFAVARLKKLPGLSPVRSLARMERGDLETIAGQEVALTARQGYVTELAPNIIGGMAPPNRQEFARWLRFAKSNKEPAISAYLLDSLLAKPSAHVVLAVDLQDMMSAKSLHAELAASATIKQRKIDLPPMEKLLLGLKGVRFAVTIDQFTYGEIWFDFTEAPNQSQADVVAALFQEWLGDIGAAIDDLVGPGVKVHVVNQSVYLNTVLSDVSLRRIMTLVPQSGGPAASVADTSANSPDGVASRRYYLAIEDILDDLRKAAKNRNYAQSTLWHETYARKIEQLSVANVAPEMAKYGASIADHLRALAASLHGVQLQVEDLEGQKRFIYYEQPPNLSYSWGGWPGNRRYPSQGWSWGMTPGNTYYYDNFAEMRGKQAEAIAKGETDRTAIWSQVEQERQAIRQKMLNQYQLDFNERVK